MAISKYQIFDLIIKGIALSVSASILVYAVYTFKEQSNREFKKPYLVAQIEACKEITKLVAKVSTIKTIEGRAKYSDELSILYFSQAVLFLNDEVLDEFRVFINATKECPGKKEINECHHLNLGGYQRNIAHACRNGLINSWSGEINNLVEEVYHPLL